MPYSINATAAAACMSPDSYRQGPSPTTKGRKTIILAESDTQLRNSLSSLLRSAGYLVFTATNPTQALGRLRNCGRTVDLLMTNIELSNGNGIQLASTTIHERPYTAVLLLSVGCQDDTLARSEYPVLRTPFSSAILLGRVTELLTDEYDPEAA